MRRALTIALALALAGCNQGHTGLRDDAGAGGGGGGDMAPPITERVFFASVGDYGSGDSHEADVANLISNADPDFVITMGDNSYPDAYTFSLLETNIGQFYSKYIGGYLGKYGIGSPINMFFPCVGNHEWYGTDGTSTLPNLQAYLDYFPDLPGNRRYFSFRMGLVQFFVVSSDDHEPDGHTADSKQGKWLQQEMAQDTGACYKLVYFHHPPYSSGDYGVTYMQWPFAAWGADAVLSGHDHIYERLSVDGIPYFVNGLGGANRFAYTHVDPHSQFRFEGTDPLMGAPDWGAQFITATKDSMTFQFVDADGGLVDTFTIQPKAPCP